jgi:hypothetical protein
MFLMVLLLEVEALAVEMVEVLAVGIPAGEALLLILGGLIKMIKLV